MSTCAHCGIVRVHIALFFQCSTFKNYKIDTTKSIEIYLFRLVDII
jgi:hypothetical protein